MIKIVFFVCVFLLLKSGKSHKTFQILLNIKKKKLFLFCLVDCDWNCDFEIDQEWVVDWSGVMIRLSVIGEWVDDEKSVFETWVYSRYVDDLVEQILCACLSLSPWVWNVCLSKKRGFIESLECKLSLDKEKEGGGGGVKW